MNRTLGFIGLGRMGKNMVLHLLEGGVDVVAYNRTKDVTQEFAKSEATDTHFTPSYTLDDFVHALPSPRVIWLMVPNGAPVDDVIGQLLKAGVTTGDTIIDGGNCFYKDSVRRQQELAQKGITFIDCGTSGGLEGARNGACLMIGGVQEEVNKLSWLWDAAAVKDGWTYFGPPGAGHFVKMVHNGVEYGIDQAFGEGFEILAKSPYQLNLPDVARNWTHGSVVRGWLVELLARALGKDPKLEKFEGNVGGGSTGGWTVESARELGVEAIVIADSLTAREKSQSKPTFAGKVVSALRNEYGGHVEAKR